jgi:CRP/FNR family transcriptional regulator, cyclic AMP receptor protein
MLALSAMMTALGAIRVIEVTNIMSSSWKLFHSSADFNTFAAGQVIFKQGEVGDVMYIVQEGEVDILLHDKVIETVEVGGILGELALIDNRPRAASAVARTDCKVVPIDEKRFAYMVQETPHFAIHVMEVMAERLRYMDSMASQQFTPFDYLNG